MLEWTNYIVTEFHEWQLKKKEKIPNSPGNCWPELKTHVRLLGS